MRWLANPLQTSNSSVRAPGSGSSAVLVPAAATSWPAAEAAVPTLATVAAWCRWMESVPRTEAQCEAPHTHARHSSSTAGVETRRPLPRPPLRCSPAAPISGAHSAVGESWLQSESLSLTVDAASELSSAAQSSSHPSSSGSSLQEGGRTLIGICKQAGWAWPHGCIAHRPETHARSPRLPPAPLARSSAPCATYERPARSEGFGGDPSSAAAPPPAAVCLGLHIGG